MELVTVNKEQEEIKEDNNEKMNEVENEWLIVIKLQVLKVWWILFCKIKVCSTHISDNITSSHSA